MSEKIGKYTIGSEIGKGSFATVYKCTDEETHEAVAIKLVVRRKLKSKKLIENLEVEILILKSMKHPHIVGLLDYHQTTTHFHLVMDYCSMGDLSYFIRRRDQLVKTHPVVSQLLQCYPSPEGSHGLNETLVIHFLKQLASALEFLRSKSLVHRDIKPQNLLLCPPAHSKEQFEAEHFVGLWDLPILKIADFGFARFLPNTSMAETLCGSPLYMAPEILRYEKYNAKADLWSVGAVFYEMTVGKPPFRAANHIELLKTIERTHDRIKFPSSAQVPESLRKLIRSLLKYNPMERVSFNEFFNHPLIVNELEGNSRPLDTSEMDTNLFISEYISPINPSDRAKFVTPITPMTSKKHSSKGERNEPRPSPTSEGRSPSSSRMVTRDNPRALIASRRSNSRDEQIKLIINLNSPDSTALSHSIQPKYKEFKQGHRLNNDVILEKDYVVVEKRAVEVNAIADELAKVGVSGTTSHHQQTQQGQGPDRTLVPVRRPSQRSANSSGRRPSFGDRRISISISPTNALGKAISLASNRLFGNNAQTAEVGDDGSQTGELKSFSTIVSSPDFANNLLLKKVKLPVSNTLLAATPAEREKQDAFSYDEKVLHQLESIATKSHAISLFADVKFSQLIPSPPSTDEYDDEIMQHNDLLPPKMIKAISEEGVVLYVKTLSLLAKGMGLASEWWMTHYDKNEHTGEQQLVRSLDLQVTSQINELVQWIRDQFNECLEKAEFIKLRLEEANESIRKDEDVTATSNFTEQMSVGGATATTISGDANSETVQVVAEKLIFDRALEISRNAAVNELVKEDLKGCELAYSTAIWMLEALLDEESSEVEKLDDEDRAMVEKFVVSIGNRLSVLKKKLEIN
uniref:Serine/threonine-protein kinase ATG1 n=1 Tax=Candidozyma auris TaxID=498019 RepID=A0A0L0P3S8_CANAR